MGVKLTIIREWSQINNYKGFFMIYINKGVKLTIITEGNGSQINNYKGMGVKLTIISSMGCNYLT